MGEIRPTFSIDAKPRYLRGLERIAAEAQIATPAAELPVTPPAVTPPQPAVQLQPVYAERGQARVQALRMVWPIVCRRLESLPNINATQLFDELCIQFPGRFTRQAVQDTLAARQSVASRCSRARRCHRLQNVSTAQ